MTFCAEVVCLTNGVFRATFRQVKVNSEAVLKKKRALKTTRNGPA